MYTRKEGIIIMQSSVPHIVYISRESCSRCIYVGLLGSVAVLSRGQCHLQSNRVKFWSLRSKVRGQKTEHVRRRTDAAEEM